jgi:hypothetical protein
VQKVVLKNTKRKEMITIKIGRDPQKNKIVIDGNNVSREHCEIVKDDNKRYKLTDYSKNGTQVKGRIVKDKSVYLMADDEVKVGGKKLLWLKFFTDAVINAPQEEQHIEIPEPPKPEPPITPPVSDFQTECNLLKQNILQLLNDYNHTLQNQKTEHYHNFSDELLCTAVEIYNRCIAEILLVLDKSSLESVAMQNKFEKDRVLLDGLRMQKMMQQADFVVVEQRKNAINNLFDEIKIEIKTLLSETIALFTQKHPLLFDNQYETADTSHSIWHKLERRDTMPVSTLFVGTNNIVFPFFDEKITVPQYKYESLLNT